MKLYKYSLCALAAGSVLASCADQDLLGYEGKVDKPASIADYEYLDEYEPLKTYVDRSASPNFKLGSGVEAPDYNSKGLVWRVSNSNFDEITPGNAMKYGSIVSDDGSMNFGDASDFVKNAVASGISVYGHTLCWHSQQNKKWLESLIADRELDVDPGDLTLVDDAVVDYHNYDSFPWYIMGYEPQIINGILTVPEYPGDWYQFFIMDGLTCVKDREYTITAKMRGSVKGQLHVQFGNWGGFSEGNLEIPDEWKEVSITLKSPDTGVFVVFQPGVYEGKLEIEWIKLSHSEAPVSKIYVPLLSGGDAENGECAYVISRYPGQDDAPSRIVDDPLGTGKVFVSEINGNPGTAWDSQFFIRSNTALKEGDNVRVKFRYRCSDTRSIDTQAHGQPGEYHHWAFIGTLQATPEWQEHEWSGTITGEHAGDAGCSSIAFNISSAPAAGQFYIDDITFEVERSANSIELTPEEKKEILVAEMERWIKGMMEATGGQVKSWDLANEVMSGDDYDGDGWFNPWTSQRVSATDAANHFYWNDYLGEMDVVRIPAKFARQYFEEAGGNPADLKLFINDYNLEANWGDNGVMELRKLRSLIHYIELWESDGVTKIDGIASQMHVTYSLNPETQRKNEENVVKMLELMAATGKLVKISELDMGISDENGQSIKTADVTLEQHKAMGEYYRYIVSKYLEVVPANQQYGITQWAQTDSPENSGWRPGEPIGLWNSSYQRKPSYGGFADGLQHK